MNQADTAVAFAVAQVGKPYQWGAIGPSSYDCSGLTQAAWGAAGVAIPRTTYGQVLIGTGVTYAAAAPGDLIFPFADISHVVMYLGNGQIVEAPQTGENVHIIPFYAAAGGIRRVTNTPGTGVGLNAANLTTATAAAASPGGSLSNISNLIKSLENPADWASMAYIVGGVVVLVLALLRLADREVSSVVKGVMHS